MFSMIMNHLRSYWNGSWFLVLFVGAFAATGAVLIYKEKNEGFTVGAAVSRALFGGLSGVYFSFLLYVAIFMRDIGVRRELELRPFHILLNWNYEKALIVENIIFFVPAGILIGMACKSVKKTLLITALISLLIEVAQFVFALGKSEVDDIICNVLGGSIGMLIVWIVARCIGSKRNEPKS
ncbi:MAG: VanZ family protein [Lachnospiraceae bacterium]|nr:VanZ family protein [Lachnospiraceae bacterium]